MQHWVNIFNAFVSNQHAVNSDSEVVFIPLVFSILFIAVCVKQISQLQKMKWKWKKFFDEFGMFDFIFAWAGTGLLILWMIAAFKGSDYHDEQIAIERPQLVKILRPQLIHGTALELTKPDGGNPQFILEAHTNHGMIVSGELLTTHGDVVNDPTNMWLDLTPVHNYTPSGRMQKTVPPQTVLHYLHDLVKKADVNDY